MSEHSEAWKIAFYNRLWKDLKKWMKKTRDFTSNMSNFAALIHEHFRENVPKSVLQRMWTETQRHSNEHESGEQTHGNNEAAPPAYVNWAGFYLMKHYFIESTSATISNDKCLFLGPFSGRPAVPIIPLTRGVCGHAVRTALAHTPAPPLMLPKKQRVDPSTLAIVPAAATEAADAMLEALEWLRVLPAANSDSAHDDKAGVFVREGGLWVPDVHAHPDHIACDAVSMAELVCPVYSSTAEDTPLVAIIDIDSPYLNAFSAIDYSFFNSAAWLLAQNSPYCHISCSKAMEAAVPVEEHVADMIESGAVACGAK